MLSDSEIIEFKSEGKLVIEPFNEDQLGPNSYDVTLGEFFYEPSHREQTVFNIGNKESYMTYWKLDENEEHLNVKKAFEIPSTIRDGFSAGEKIIFIKPGDTILAHTNEFIGGFDRVTTEMKAKSTMGRSCITVCACAGLGDIGYINRWTMEIKNQGNKVVALKVGMRLAQICFFHTGECNRPYYQNGQYQTTSDLDEIKANWNPTMMLPSYVRK